jgi:hypothetical protein
MGGRKGGRCLVLRRKKNFFLYIYDVITSPEKEKRAVTHYSNVCLPV